MKARYVTPKCGRYYVLQWESGTKTVAFVIDTVPLMLFTIGEASPWIVSLGSKRGVYGLRQVGDTEATPARFVREVKL